MKRLCSFAVLMALCSSAYAGGSISFTVGGHRVHIESSRHCRSTSCASVSVSGVNERRSRSITDREEVTPVRTAPPVSQTVSPPPAPAPAPPPTPAMAPGGPAISVSIPDFVDRNYIGREPMKESILACKPLETVRLLQMREPIARHVHERLDEVVYVVAGEGAVKVGDESVALRPGSLIVLPHGSGHAFERRGKNPLVILSTLVGSACEQSKSAP